MAGDRRKDVIVIRRSCITGKVVWIYRGASKRAAYTAYCRACKAELKRTRKFNETAAQRRKNILNILNECLSDLPVTAKLTKSQAEAARQLRMISKEDIACHKEFAEHIREERRRRRETQRIHKEMRERNNNNNLNKKEEENENVC